MKPKSLLVALAWLALTAVAPPPAAAQCEGAPPDVTGCWEWVCTTCEFKFMTPGTEGYTEQLQFDADGTLTVFRDEAFVYAGHHPVECLSSFSGHYYWGIENCPYIGGRVDLYDGGETLFFMNMHVCGAYDTYITRHPIVAEGSDTWGKMKAIFR